MNDQESNIVFESSANFTLLSRSGVVEGETEAQLQLREEELCIRPKLGDPLLIKFRDILNTSAVDYKVELTLGLDEKAVLSKLGYRYDDFLRVFYRLRNEMLLKDMLMHESLRKSGVEAEVSRFDESGTEKSTGKCNLRLYETGIVIMPEKDDIIRIPYCDIEEVKESDYNITIRTEYDEGFVFSKMARQFDPFKKTLSDLMNELGVKVQESLKELMPEANPLVIRKAARYMREGKSARRSDIEAISPELWAELEKKLEVAGIKEEYDFLNSLSQREKICIGLKRGLLGDLTGEYIWFLIPIYSTSPTEPGNAVAMEAASSEGTGKATYFFRLVSRESYPKFKSIEDLHNTADAFIKRINRSMIAINFRREPIYLPDEKLNEPQYQKYKFAIARIPALRELRELFIGRVIHRTEEQWKEDVMDLLGFNVSVQDDSAKWKKGAVENEVT